MFEGDSVADAKAVLNADTPADLVFTNVNLRGEENGFVLARWIREHHPNTQVLLASGVGNAAEKVRRAVQRWHHAQTVHTPGGAAANSGAVAEGGEAGAR